MRIANTLQQIPHEPYQPYQTMTDKPTDSDEATEDRLPACTCSLWTCCERSRRTKFCPECGTIAPQCNEATEMLAEIQIEARKYTTTADTFTAQAEELEKVVGYLPEDCGWSIMEAARVIDSYDVHATMAAISEMEPQELRERFARGLKSEARGKRKMASAATKNMLKWRRWYRTLEALMSQSNPGLIHDSNNEP